SGAAPRGEVEIEDEDVTQSGWSAVEFVRWVEAGSRLVGKFESPLETSPRQHFSISVDTGDDANPAVFDLAGGSPVEPGSIRSVDLPLRTTEGLVRIRLTAKGPGSAGRWQNLRLVGESTTAAHTTESAPDPPRVVLVYVLDALRADFVDHLGATIGASPCIDRLASEGAVFRNHFSVAPNTGPATKSLFTGHGFLQGRALSPSGPETLAEVFTQAGFVTASFSSNPHLTPGFGLTRGFEHYEYLPIVQDHRRGGKVVVNDSARRVHRAVLRWLDNRAVDESFFLYLHTLHPHNPYTPPRPYPRRFVSASAKHLDGRTRTLASIRDAEREVTLEDQKWLRQRYAANLAYNDAELCTLMEEIQRRFPGQAMVVITSDHGEELFDHDGVLHGYTLYDEMLHVPMVVWWPGVVPHTVVAEPTDTLDLHASLVNLVRPGEAGDVEGGRALWDAIFGEWNGGREPNLHFATAPGLRMAAMARSERWKLIRVPRPRFDWGMGRGRGRTHDAEYLFHLEFDPGEHRNVAGSSSIEADWLRSRLQAWEATWRLRQEAGEHRTEIDRDTRRQLEALGYVD
ncbi:MAG: sulfatase, partial [Acidobacteria bacterium]|nr:sulfatase [Acidobacteriota bacterium]